MSFAITEKRKQLLNERQSIHNFLSIIVFIGVKHEMERYEPLKESSRKIFDTFSII